MSLDSVLYRPLKDGNQYDALLPATKCERTKLGKGNTDYSIEQMVAMVEMYHQQTEKLAQVLKQGSLDYTVSSIHDFLFNHLQYKADESDQMLRSPACSWYDRVNGIDCKSYSIFASCILMNLEINHYIRKIKQPTSGNPDDFSHVYVIVPVDQVSGALENGYYVIDGTLESNQEPIYSEPKDFYMNSEYGHYGLNGSSKTFSFNDIKSLFSSNIDCLGGTAYNKSVAENDLSMLSSRLGGYIDQINAAVVSGDMVKLSQKVNQYIGEATWFASTCGYKRAERDWNSCSSANLKAVHEAANFYRYTTVKALQIWLTEYFDSFPNGAKYYANTEFMGKSGTQYYTTDGQLRTSPTPFPIINAEYGEQISWNSEFLIFEIPYFNYLIKPTKNIPKFEITQPVLDANANLNSLTPQNLLGSLSNILVTAQNLPSSGTGTSSGASSGSAGTYEEQNPKTEKAGFGILGWGIVAIGLGIAFTKLKDKPQQK